jgi:broad specificity phosphatase PhoE
MNTRQSRLSSVVLGILLLAASTVEAGPVLAVDSDEATVVFLVRHAEKAQVDDHGKARGPDLTEAGRRRAETLSRVLAPAGITRIYSTDYRRTLETARPVAEAEGLEVETYDARAPDALVSRLRQSQGRHLVVGHSNTTPELVAKLGGEPGPPIDEECEYDRLYVLVLGPDRSVTTVRQRYGSPSCP